VNLANALKYFALRCLAGLRDTSFNRSLKLTSESGTELIVLIFLLFGNICAAQDHSKAQGNLSVRKNIVRYNLSGALLFGADRYFVVGYERVLTPRQSFSVNVGRAALPKLINLPSSTFRLNEDLRSTGFNLSVDYRFYLQKENKFAAPHGVYLGPYYAYNHFVRDNEWLYENSSATNFVKTHSELSINALGVEVGYQFILWKRLALDLVMVGPGIAFYNFKADVDSNVDAAAKEQLYQSLTRSLFDKIPGMNYVFADQTVKENGSLRTTNFGYRYIIHIGYSF
jgi:hypothetical protein